MHSPIRRRQKPSQRRPSALRSLLTSESAGGVALMAMAALALIVANSPVAPYYFAVLKTYVGGLSVLHWINDALMAIFFLLVGLEIKREFLDGQLASWPRRILPGAAAAGGMAFPALLYVVLNINGPETLRGWAIPTATDIAFALGVLALLGSRVPVSLKVFLTALAIIDDLGAVTLIAIFYTAELSVPWLSLAGIAILALTALNKMGVERLAPYSIVGAILWFFMLNSGVHATLAGVALALSIPIKRSRGRPDDPFSLLHRLEHALQPWVAFFIVPVFGFANAGVSLSGMTWDAVIAPIPVGIAAGLFLGKQIGVFLTAWTAIKLKWADCPEDASLTQLYGVSVLCGIGFTMSLFIGLLAFPVSIKMQDEVKIGVLVGSVLAAIVGSLILIYDSKWSNTKSLRI